MCPVRSRLLTQLPQWPGRTSPHPGHQENFEVYSDFRGRSDHQDRSCASWSGQWTRGWRWAVSRTAGLFPIEEPPDSLGWTLPALDPSSHKRLQTWIIGASTCPALVHPGSRKDQADAGHLEPYGNHYCEAVPAWCFLIHPMPGMQGEALIVGRDRAGTLVPDEYWLYCSSML